MAKCWGPTTICSGSARRGRSCAATAGELRAVSWGSSLTQPLTCAARSARLTCSQVPFGRSRERNGWPGSRSASRSRAVRKASALGGSTGPTTRAVRVLVQCRSNDAGRSLLPRRTGEPAVATTEGGCPRTGSPHSSPVSLAASRNVGGGAEDPQDRSQSRPSEPTTVRQSTDPMAGAGVPCKRFTQDLTPLGQASDDASCDPALSSPPRRVAIRVGRGADGGRVPHERRGVRLRRRARRRWTLTLAAAQCSDVAGALNTMCMR